MTKDRNSIIAWLAIGAIMVASMVVIGGITRLTHSGLSMTDWKLILGMIPPLNEAEWQSAFDQYKQFPEYQTVNNHFTLSEFKSIFFWEYLHRLIGRLIGIVFIIPFFVFLFRKSIKGKLLFQCLTLLGLGALQGFLGWFMVKSGLIDRPSVSHYRLAIHLSAAFLTFCYIIWVILSLVQPTRTGQGTKELALLSRLLTLVISMQIVFGAFVAGLKAGLVFPTWPKMGNDWIPAAVSTGLRSQGLESLFSQIVSVQFVHRTFAYLVVIMVAVVWVKAKKLNLNRLQNNSVNVLVTLVVIQFLLGVFTLLYLVPVALGVAHQVGALFLLTTSVVLNYTLPTKAVS
ncbi:COX15/CtaA family protein [Bacteroidota bacterium]